MLTDKDTAYIADLIKIKIPEAELPKYTKQLNTVLPAVEVMKELDTQNVAPTAQTHGLTNVFREDTPKPGLDLKEYKNREHFQPTTNTFVVDQVIPND
jgi:aspartyl-tRNA(Asn)/glutamyl-tRNA(Gln) amidotransferase subunit C